MSARLGDKRQQKETKNNRRDPARRKIYRNQLFHDLLLEMELLQRAPHLIAILVMLCIFAAWAIPLLRLTNNMHVASVWSRQFSVRV